MYSGTPCDECGGPTLELNSGSIWCPAEGPHAGGHFVMRMGMTPRLDGKITSRQRTDRTGPRVRKVAEIAAKVEAERLLNGYDDFVRSDR